MLTDSNFSVSNEKETLFTKKINKISVNLRFMIILRHFNFFSCQRVDNVNSIMKFRQPIFLTLGEE